jgi:putative membrane protein
VYEMMWGDYSGGWWIVMWLSMAVFWGLVIVGAVLLVNSFSRNDRPEGDSPDETLKRRLARGEIDQEQYRVLSDEIHGRPHGPTAAVH